MFKGYLVFMVIANLIYIIFSIIAAVKARKGRMYYFIFFGKIAYLQTFQVREEKQVDNVNLPPKMD